MTIRLNKVTRDLNVGITTAVEFLQKKGFTVEANPNTKITDEQFELLKKEFSTDKDLKIKSERFSQERQSKDRNKASVSIDGYRETQEKAKPEEIKTVVPEDARPKFKPVGKIDLDKLNRRPGNLLAGGKSVLCEGAQGTMLDIDFGSYPFVTSSNTVCAGACTGLGIAPNKIGEVYGIFKAYCTRVGAGPFPTELFDKTGDQICTLGHEFGSVTGRKRRCGWIDLVALKYAIMVDGVTKLIMMKSDVLDSFETIKACVAYKMDEEEIDYFPFDINETVEPVYVELPGWQTDMTKMQSEDEFPEEFNAYLSFLEEQLGVPIKIVSLGPDREQTIERYTEE